MELERTERDLKDAEVVFLVDHVQALGTLASRATKPAHATTAWHFYTIWIDHLSRARPDTVLVLPQSIPDPAKSRACLARTFGGFCERPRDLVRNSPFIPTKAATGVNAIQPDRRGMNVRRRGLAARTTRQIVAVHHLIFHCPLEIHVPKLICWIVKRDNEQSISVQHVDGQPAQRVTCYAKNALVPGGVCCRIKRHHQPLQRDKPCIVPRCVAGTVGRTTASGHRFAVSPWVGRSRWICATPTNHYVKNS